MRKVNTLEGGTNGVTVTQGVGGNTGGASGDFFDVIVTGGSFTNQFSTLQAMHGTLSLRQAGGSASQAHFRWDLSPALDRLFFRFYFRTATISTARSLMQLRVASAQALRVALSGSALDLNNAGNTTLDTSTTLSSNTWYRVEGDVQQSTGNATVHIYVGDNLTALDTLSASGASLGTADYDEIRFGQIANATGLPDLFFDGLDVNDVGFPGPWLQTVAPGGIASGEAFGTLSVGQTVVVGGIGSAEAFGTADVSQPSSSQGITATGIASGEAFGTASLTLTVSPSGIASGEAFGTASLAVTITPAGISSAETFGSASLALGVAPAGIPSGEAFGSASLRLSVSPAGIGSAEAFGSSSVSVGPVAVSPSGIGSAEAFGTPVVSAGGFVVQPTGITSAEAFGAAAVTTGPVSVAPTGVVSAEVFGTAGFASGVTLAGIPSGEAFGTTVVTTGSVGVSPAGISSTEAFGTAVFSGGASAGQPIGPVGIPSGEIFGRLVATLLAGVDCGCVEPAPEVLNQFGMPAFTVLA